MSVDPHNLINPFKYLASEAGKVIADGWTSAMLGLWNAGLWALRLVLNIIDSLLTPDLSANGPGAAAYRTTFWLAGVLVVVMLIIQLGLAVIRRNGKSLALVLLGLGQFVAVWAGWISFGVAVVAGCGGLTRALMESLLNVTTWSSWQPWQPFGVGDITDGTVATVLGLMGLFLWLAAITHLLVMITRSAALIVLAAVTPIAAAGLVSEAGRAWLWKSLRWFIAAAFAPVSMVLVLGIGVQITTGVANGLTNKIEQAIGTALPGVILILIASVAPAALFKLLAFVDPNTSSGAALRLGLAEAGGLRGVLGNVADGGDGSTVGSDGRSEGEAASEDSTSARLSQAQSSLLRSFGGGVGTAVGFAQGIGSRATAIGSDLTNQMGVGHLSYYPDVNASRISRGPGGPADYTAGGDGHTNAEQPSDEGGLNGSGSNPPQDALLAPAPTQPPYVPTDPSPRTPAGTPPGQMGSFKGGGAADVGGGGAAAGEAAGAAATVPIVPI
jgi:type IV secretion system protein TrbL